MVLRAYKGNEASFNKELCLPPQLCRNIEHVWVCIPDERKMKTHMIIRVWRGWADRAKSEDYPDHFRRAVLPDLRATDGFLGATLMRQDEAGHIEFVVMTRWASLDAIRAFAGETLERAVVEPGAVAALERFDETVQHYEVVDAAEG
jgi:heme-degrading monooxygenase HmoA